MHIETGRKRDEGPWYLAYTEPRRELVAQANLERQGYDTYLPMYGTAAPLFPRYLFVRPGRSTQSIAPVRSTRGVQAVVRFGTHYALVTAALLAAIREQVKEHALHARGEDAGMQPGQRVRVQGNVPGLAGLEGLVDSSANRRVIVLMEILGRQTPVSLAADHLEAV